MPSSSVEPLLSGADAGDVPGAGSWRTAAEVPAASAIGEEEADGDVKTGGSALNALTVADAAVGAEAKSLVC